MTSLARRSPRRARAQDPQAILDEIAVEVLARVDRLLATRERSGELTVIVAGDDVPHLRAEGDLTCIVTRADLDDGDVW